MDGLREIAEDLRERSARGYALDPSEQTSMAEVVAALERVEKEVKGALNVARELMRRPVGRPPRAQVTRPVSRDIRYTGMTTAEAAVVLDVSEEYVRRLLRKGRLDGVPFGGRTGWRLDREYVRSLGREIKAAKEGKATARTQLLTADRPERSAGRRQAAGSPGGA